jgi:hypothetical protein
MTHSEDPAQKDYPHGRGYGHDYMRGGEVFGGYGYSDRHEYDTPRGALQESQNNQDSAPGDDQGEENSRP